MGLFDETVRQAQEASRLADEYARQQAIEYAEKTAREKALLHELSVEAIKTLKGHGVPLVAAIETDISVEGSFPTYNTAQFKYWVYPMGELFSIREADAAIVRGSSTHMVDYIPDHYQSVLIYNNLLRIGLKPGSRYQHYYGEIDPSSIKTWEEGPDHFSVHSYEIGDMDTVPIRQFMGQRIVELIQRHEREQQP